jgi:hypothetical protein
MEIACTFGNKAVYTCDFKNQNIPENVQIKPKGSHKFNQSRVQLTNENVIAVIFDKCTVTKVPKGLTRIFPNMKIFSIYNSNLKVVTKSDLAEYKNIERIGFCDNQIEYLPGDLFEGFTNLEIIRFYENKLNLIEPNILDGLENLKAAMFTGNSLYTKMFSKESGYQSNATLEEVKDELFVRFYKNHGKVVDLLKFEAENGKLKKKIENMNKYFELRFKKQELIIMNQSLLQNTPKTFEFDIKRFLEVDKNFKDFRIQIDDKEFPVHKFLLATRSPTLAELLEANPQVENLKLFYISVDTFEIILKFLYTDELPGDEGTNYLHIFAAAGKLKIKELKNHAAMKLMDQIDKNNALDIFKISKRYEHDILRQCAFNKIKEEYPKIKFQEEWAVNVNAVVEIIKAFEMKVEIIKKAEEEYNNISNKLKIININ